MIFCSVLRILGPGRGLGDGGCGGVLLLQQKPQQRKKDGKYVGQSIDEEPEFDIK